MKTKSWLLVFLCLVAPAALALIALAGPLYQSGHEPTDKEAAAKPEEEAPVDISKLTPYSRVGVIMFEEADRVDAGQERFMAILLGRLKHNCPKTEFVEVEVDLPPDTPLMGVETRKLGEEKGLDAVITGAFSVTVVGGTYPTQSNSIPVGSFAAECRVLDTKTGWSRGKVFLEWKKNKVYSSSVTTQRDLEGKIMRDGAEDLISKLINKGYVFFEPEPGTDEASADGSVSTEESPPGSDG